MGKQGKPGQQTKQRKPGMSDMVRSLAVVIAVVAVLGWIAGPHGKPPVQRADVATELSAAREGAGYQVLAPAGLASDWKPTSAWNSHPDGAKTPWHFHVGYLTPSGQYAGADESNDAQGSFVAALLGAGWTRSGDEQIAGVAWQRLRAANGETALLRRNGPASVVVTGSAQLGELRYLASSLS